MLPFSLIRKEGDMLYSVTTDKDLETVCGDLQEAVARHKFGVLHVHNLKETMARKGVEFGPQCRIFEVCNPHQAKKVLEQNLDISTALPCRISVFEEQGKVKLSTIKPTMMLQMFSEPGLAGVAGEVERTIVAIMDEAAGKG
jgi:uncharacterized protein (DUF302 family)